MNLRWSGAQPPPERHVLQSTQTMGVIGKVEDHPSPLSNAAYATAAATTTRTAVHGYYRVGQYSTIDAPSDH